MTGRELILYILANGLEEEPVFKDGRLLGYMTLLDAALQFDVGTATVISWINNGLLEGIEIDGTIHVPANAEHPNKSSCDREE